MIDISSIICKLITKTLQSNVQFYFSYNTKPVHTEGAQSSSRAGSEAPTPTAKSLKVARF